MREAMNPPRVLIVEDNDADYLLLRRQVVKLLAPPICSRAATRAELSTALMQDWELIITDYHLPDIERKELLDAIARAHPRTPCLVLSGSSYELEDVAAPGNVFAKLEKGDFAGLRSALNGDWSNDTTSSG